MRLPRRTAAIVLPTLGLVVMVACDGGPTKELAQGSPARGEPTTSTVVDAPAATTVPPPTTAVPTSTAVPPPDTIAPSPGPSDGNPLALDVLAWIAVAREVPAGYDRDLFGGWIDADGDGCNTREEVLIAESRTPAQVDPYGCKVLAGDWFSVYEGATWSDPAEVDIDHVVALKEAWDSGAHAWSSARRRAFANDLGDPRSLRAVTDNVNRAKGEADPSNWLPSRDSFLCAYVSDWIAIKAHWGLSMDESEYGRLRNLLRGPCAGTTVAPRP